MKSQKKSSRSAEVIHDVFGREITIYIRFPPKSRFFRGNDQGDLLQGINKFLEEFHPYKSAYCQNLLLELNPKQNKAGKIDENLQHIYERDQQSNQEQMYSGNEVMSVRQELKANNEIQAENNELLHSTLNQLNTDAKEDESKANKEVECFTNSRIQIDSASILTHLRHIQLYDLDIRDGLKSNLLFTVKQYENMDLIDTFIKNQVFQCSEQFSFIRVYGLHDIETGKNIIFREDEDFYKVKSVPMGQLRDNGEYELILSDKRLVLQQDVPDEVKESFREEFDEILTCSFNMQDIDDFIDDVRKKREEKGTDVVFIQSIISSTNEEVLSKNQSHTCHPVKSFIVSNNPKKIGSNNTKSSTVRVPKHRVLTREQIERYFSKNFYTEMISIRDLIESKMVRNPTIDNQLELQYEIQIEEAMKKRNNIIHNFMEMDMNYSNYITWEEFCNHKCDNWLKFHTKQMQEKYFTE